MKAAVIDLGTNTFQLLIAEPDGSGAFIPLQRERVFVKIGKGGIQDGLIVAEAFERALHTFERLCQVAKEAGVPETRIKATATSAIRSARNGQALIKQMQQKTNILPVTISGEQEAQLIYEGVKTVIDMGNASELIVDIGGGSVEFICCNAQQVFWKQSYEAGAQRLLARFHHSEPMAQTEHQAMMAYFAEAFSKLDEVMEKYAPRNLIGCAGTFSTMRDMWVMRQKLPNTDKSKAFPIAPSDYLSLHQSILQANLAERLQIPGMLAERADMIVVASCVVEYLLKRYRFQQLLVSPASLKEGVLASWIEQEG